jgi:hypothetical protein
MKKELIYVEHFAGDFEDMIQVCIYCGKVITDYSGGGWVSSDDSALKGYASGSVWMTGTNPVTTQAYKPEKNYGPDDPFTRKIIKCTDR